MIYMYNLYLLIYTNNMIYFFSEDQKYLKNSGNFFINLLFLFLTYGILFVKLGTNVQKQYNLSQMFRNSFGGCQMEATITFLLDVRPKGTQSNKEVIAALHEKCPFLFIKEIVAYTHYKK